MRYPVFLFNDSDDAGNHSIGVEVPDLPGCFSFGVDILDALFMAKDAIDCHVGAYISVGEIFSYGSSIEDYMHDSKYQHGLFVYVDVDLGLENN